MCCGLAQAGPPQDLTHMYADGVAVLPGLTCPQPWLLRSPIGAATWQESSQSSLAPNLILLDLEDVVSQPDMVCQ